MRWLFVLILIFVGYAAMSGTAERWVIYPLDPTEVSPVDAGVPAMEVQTLSTTDGETLVLWVGPPRPGKPVIVYFQGNAGNLAIRAPRFRAFMDRGYGVIGFAYRGSSGSTGSPSQTHIETDIDDFLATLTTRIDTSGGVIFYGESIGTGAAIYAAMQYNAQALVLEAPFTSIPALLETHYPQFASAGPLLENQWPSLERIAELRTPLLILHGTHDTLIPHSMAEELLTASPASDKALFSVQGAGHTNVWQSNAQATLYRFLNRF
ncbi:alpha/beta hydrolase [Cochlodiniinecator piscidefendens]|uniref:alpha/beta hydrolase n=1 Tax=Cochlodiniinecator piscidefendens TaxID=2715756 RepID=UPI001408A074|nr:alpha/beta hydrolase [Cochlodiniinecator piscidefendens]